MMTIRGKGSTNQVRLGAWFQIPGICKTIIGFNRRSTPRKYLNEAATLGGVAGIDAIDENKCAAEGSPRHAAKNLMSAMEISIAFFGFGGMRGPEHCQITLSASAEDSAQKIGDNCIIINAAFGGEGCEGINKQNLCFGFYMCQEFIKGHVLVKQTGHIEHAGFKPGSPHPITHFVIIPVKSNILEGSWMASVSHYGGADGPVPYHVEKKGCFTSAAGPTNQVQLTLREQVVNNPLQLIWIAGGQCRRLISHH